MKGRKRTATIQVRVTEQEKRQLVRKARRSGLSLSEHLRQAALERPAAMDPRIFRALCAQAERLRKPIYTEDPVEGDIQLEELFRLIRSIYATGGVDGGDDEDLANQG